MIRLALTFLASLVFAACEVTNIDPPPPAQPPGPPGIQMTLSASERAACEADGGFVERAGMLGAERCTRAYSDGGTLCTDSSQCEGDCRSDDLGGASRPPGTTVTGTCQRNDNPFGCYGTVENGQLGPGLCVD